MGHNSQLIVKTVQLSENSFVTQMLHKDDSINTLTLLLGTQCKEKTSGTTSICGNCGRCLSMVE